MRKAGPTPSIEIKYECSNCIYLYSVRKLQSVFYNRWVKVYYCDAFTHKHKIGQKLKTPDWCPYKKVKI